MEYRLRCATCSSLLPCIETMEQCGTGRCNTPSPAKKCSYVRLFEMRHNLVEGLLLCCSSNKENVKLKYYWLLKNGSKFIVLNSQQSARYAHSHMHILFPRSPWLLSAREKWTFATIQTRSNRRIILLSHETGANERIQSNLSPSTCKSAIASAQGAAATRIN